MTVLGLRCSSKDFSFVILEGSKTQPLLIQNETRLMPRGYSKQQSLKWFHQEIADLCALRKVQTVVIKGTEAMASRDVAFVARVEFEAIVFLVAEDLGISRVCRKVKATMAKHLGLKGKASYLTKHDTTAIPQFCSMSEKQKEAGLAAWSEL